MATHAPPARRRPLPRHPAAPAPPRVPAGSRTPPRRFPSTRLLTTTVLGLVGVVLVVGGVRAAGAREEPACGDVAARYASQVPQGWTLECADRLPPEWGAPEGSSMSSRSARRIVVVDGQSPAYTASSIAHEIAHAESTAWAPEVRAAFASAVGQETWAGRQGAPAPVEVFAESSVRCRGLPTHLSYPVVPCDLVEAARTAGGAAAPLPVEGIPAPGTGGATP